MRAADEAAYREYVTARLDPLRRSAYLLCRSWHTADDLVSITLGKLYRHWRRAERADHLDAYVRGILVHTWLDERRRPWRREQPVDEVPEPYAPHGSAVADVDERLGLLDLLATLPPRRRAVVVLRFYDDVSVQQTASVLGCSTGTVKSQTSRALDQLRGRLVGGCLPMSSRVPSDAAPGSPR